MQSKHVLEIVHAKFLVNAAIFGAARLEKGFFAAFTAYPKGCATPNLDAVNGAISSFFPLKHMFEGRRGKSNQRPYAQSKVTQFSPSSHSFHLPLLNRV